MFLLAPPFIYLISFAAQITTPFFHFITIQIYLVTYEMVLGKALDTKCNDQKYFFEQTQSVLF